MSDEIKKKVKLEKGAEKATRWIGSTSSLVVHTIIFIICFILPFLGISLDRVLLVLTTIVSLEAIYLGIFIQMTVNKNTSDIEDIAEDVEDIQEDVEEIEHDVDEIQKDVEEIAEDVEDIQEDVDEIEKDVDEIQEDVEGIEGSKNTTTMSHISHNLPHGHPEILEKIQHVLEALAKDVEALKNKEK